MGLELRPGLTRVKRVVSGERYCCGLAVYGSGTKHDEARQGPPS